MINSTKNPAEAFFKTVRVDYPLGSAALLTKKFTQTDNYKKISLTLKNQSPALGGVRGGPHHFQINPFFRKNSSTEVKKEIKISFLSRIAFTESIVSCNIKGYS
jgi:hypothetical protein